MKIEKNEILALLKNANRGLMKFPDIAAALKISRNERRLLGKHLNSLVRDGTLVKLKGRKYALTKQKAPIEGLLDIASRGYGFVRPTGKMDHHPKEDIFISRRNLASALDGDKVAVRIISESDKGYEGRVVEVLERRHKSIVGQFYSDKKGGFVVPRNRRISRNIIVPPPSKKLRVKNGNWVLARITQWTEGREPLRGEITEIIGSQDDKGIDILLVLRDNGVQIEFNNAVLQELQNAHNTISKSELKRRTDLRNLTTFTIDPADAKDFDDALSIETLGTGRCRLGVHIADVSHFIRQGTELDKSALQRATSIYPVDRVVPMLPDILSSNLCSLRPDEDRLAMSVIMDIDDAGIVRDYQIHNSVIRSCLRLTYEEAQGLFDQSDSWAIAKCSKVKNDLLALKDLSERLTRMRQARGALDLDLPETEVVFDSSGKVINVRRHNRLASHRLVEECMLTANETIAQHLEGLRIPSIYRIHLPPRFEELLELLPALNHLGVKIRLERDIRAADFQAALKMTEKLHAGHIIRRLILRSLMRAEYFAQNKGHFGLASRCYTHFTSPIRRYPDLIVHRILKNTLPGKNISDSKKLSLEKTLPAIAQHSSDMERRADDIEMEATNIKSLEFMRKFVGDEFEGFISGITGFGFFVELDLYPVEGMVALRNMKGKSSRYKYDKEKMILKGQAKGDSFKIGDKVIVQIEKIDPLSSEMDLGLVRKL